jgi:hypothetical protein
MQWTGFQTGRRNTAPGRPKPGHGRAGEEPDPADQRGPTVSARGRRIGTRLPGPSDQVEIDGPWLSSSSSRGSQGRNPSAARPGAGTHLGSSPMTRR